MKNSRRYEELFNLLVSVRLPNTLRVMTSKTRGSAAFRLLRLWVRIPQAVWMSVSCDCCVFLVEVSATGRSLVRRSATECLSAIECDAG